MSGFSEEFLQQMCPPSSRQYWRGNKEERNQVDAYEEEILRLRKENDELKEKLDRLILLYKEINRLEEENKALREQLQRN